VAATAYANTPDQYVFLDNDPLPGTNYYRLAVVDQDAAVTYSPIHSVNFEASGLNVMLTVYPNPVVGELHLAFTGSAGGTIDLRLVNSQGQVIRSMTATSAAALSIPMNGLARGIYFLQINGTNGRYVQTIMKD